MTVSRLLDDFLSLFFPHYCMSCQVSLVGGEEILCTRCILDLPKTNYHLNDSPVKDRLHGRLPLTYGLAFLKFRKGGSVQRLLHELKYRQHPEVGVKLGKIYGKDLRDAGFGNQFDLIVPVPLHPVRLRKRGYNQAAMFAEGMSYALQVQMDESVSVRKANTSTQTSKSKLERWENVKDVFAIRPQADIAGKRVLLVDDVITTGATMEACGQHLIQSGCAELSVACIAEAQ